MSTAMPDNEEEVESHGNSKAQVRLVFWRRVLLVRSKGSKLNREHSGQEICTLTTWDRMARTRGSVIGGIILGGFIAVEVRPDWAVIGGLIGAVVGLLIAWLDASSTNY